MDPFLPDDQKVAAVRALLPATGAGIYLDAPTAGPLPAETDRALREADEWELRVGRGGPHHPEDAALRRSEAASVVAAVLGGGPDEILLGAGVRSVLGALLRVLPGVARRLVPAAGLEPGLLDAADAIASGSGWTVHPLDAWRREPGPATILAPAVRFDDGARTDLVGLAGLAHRAGALLVVDVTHAAGAIPFDLPATGVDAAVLATDRWLLGPDGTAAGWLSPGLGRDVPYRARRLVDPLPRRAALGLARGVGWLLMYVGLPWALERTARGARRLAAALRGIAGVQVLTPPDVEGPMLVFRIRGWSADEAAEELGRRSFAILGRDAVGGLLRVGVGAWTTDAEIDRFAASVGELAVHTPDTLPRRNPLVVLGDG